MADNSLRLIGIEGKQFVLRTEMLKRLQELKDHVDAEDLVLQGEIDGLIRDLGAETLARQNGDTTLNNKFNNYYTKAQTDLKTFTTALTEDLTVPENEELTGLETGWHTTGNHVVYFGDNIEPVFGENVLFYFNSEHENQWFYVMPPNALDGWNEIAIWLWFDTYDNVWQYAGHDIQTTISNSSTDMSVPTAAAVYEFVNGSYQPKLTEGNGIDITGNLISASHDYSSTEQVVGTWTDGKPLYEKTITKSVAANSADEVTIADDVDKIFLKQSQAVTTNSGYKSYTPLPFYFSNGTRSVSIYCRVYDDTHEGSVVIANQWPSSDADFEIVVNYTKTTD